MGLKTIEIDGRRYDIAPFLGAESFRIAYLIQKKVLPALAGVLKGFDTTGGMSGVMQSNIDLSVVQGGLDNLFANLGDDDEALALVKRILANTSAYGKKDGDKIFRFSSERDFDEFFAGQIDLIYKLVFEVLKINYPFLEGAAESLSKLTTKTSTSGAPATRTTNDEETSESSPISTKNSKPKARSGASVLSRVLGMTSPSE